MSLAVEQGREREPALALEDVQAAAARIAGWVVATPLLESPLLSEELGFRLLLKAECLQLTGSFKVRGAFNQILQLDEEEKRRGVVALSSGNHAQAVAYACKSLDAVAVIVMPNDAPSVKIFRTRRFGAEVVAYDAETEDRELIARKVASDRGLRIIHPYDDPRTIAGQGTVGLEIFQQTAQRSLTPDAIVVGCGGGGLAAGLALAGDLYARPPQIFTAEPVAFNDMQRSLAWGGIVASERRSGSICDALVAASPGAETFPILHERHAEGLAVGDVEVEAAMAIAAGCFDLVLEPGGAIALACALQERQRFADKTVVVVASGGNVGTDDFAQMIQRGAACLRAAAITEQPLFGMSAVI